MTLKDNTKDSEDLALMLSVFIEELLHNASQATDHLRAQSLLISLTLMTKAKVLSSFHQQSPTSNWISPVHQLMLLKPNDQFQLQASIVIVLRELLLNATNVSELQCKEVLNHLMTDSLKFYLDSESVQGQKRSDYRGNFQSLDISFNTARSNNVSFEKDNTVCHEPNGKSFCLLNQGLGGSAGGFYQWKVTVIKEKKGNEGTCIGVSLANPTDYVHRSTKDMWLYRAYSGSRYHNGEIHFDGIELPEYTEGDTISVLLNMTEKSLSFAKNNGDFKVAFTNLPTNAELFPCVIFYSNTSGERVRFHDLGSISATSEFHFGDPFCSPESESITENRISLLRDLYAHNDLWKNLIEEFLDDILLNIASSKLLGKSIANLNTSTEEANGQVDHLTQHYISALLLLGGCDQGVGIGSRVTLKDDGSREGIVFGSPDSTSATLKVIWLQNHSTSLVRAEQVILKDFANDCHDGLFNEYLLGNPARILSLIEIAGLGENPPLTVPLDDVYAILDAHQDAGSKEWNVPEEAKLSKTKGPIEKYFKPKTKPKVVLTTPNSGGDERQRSGSRSVELMTDLLVNSIIEEVTGKASAGKSEEDNQTTPEETSSSSSLHPLRTRAGRLKRMLDDEKAKELKIAMAESIVLRSTMLQYLAGKTLSRLFQTMTFETDPKPSDSLIGSTCLEEIHKVVQDCLKFISTNHCAISQSSFAIYDRTLAMLKKNSLSKSGSLTSSTSHGNRSLKAKIASKIRSTNSRQTTSQQATSSSRSQFPSRLSNLTPTEQLTVATAAALEAGPIHDLLR